jgi:tRNA modification GTPase
MEDTTIAAAATFPAESAIGVIRVSGKGTRHAVSSIFSFKNRSASWKNIKPNYACLGYISGGSGPVDEAMLTFFKSPRSYTGEDMAEISCHGNPFIIDQALDLLYKNGCVPASPGEFTKRAFLNGKLDLSQAEAVADMISARNSAALRLALRQLSGGETAAIKQLKDSIASVLSLIEAEIDFAHEDLRKTPPQKARLMVEKITARVDRLLQNSDSGLMLKSGIKLVICGRPNTGKSSLFNALLNRDRAIVTRSPGTTRDTVESGLELLGLPFRIFDTAGIRKAPGAAEREGVKRARAAASSADIAVFVMDGSTGPGRQDRAAYDRIRGGNIIVALNKNDLKHAFSAAAAAKFLSLPPGAPVLRISALDRSGINDLTKTIKNIIISKAAPAATGDILITSLRHRDALKKTLRSLKDAVAALDAGSFESAAFDIKDAAGRLAGLTGEVTSDEVLDGIFKKFCIGK